MVMGGGRIFEQFPYLNWQISANPIIFISALKSAIAF